MMSSSSDPVRDRTIELDREIRERAVHEGRRQPTDHPKRPNGDAKGGDALPIIFGIPTGREQYRWLADGLLPEVGVALFAGQRGMLKTFALLDLCAEVHSGGTFAGRPVAKGGTLYFAAEAPAQIPDRLRALEAAGKLNPQAFAWVESAPTLLQAGALETLVATAESAKAKLAALGLPLLLIVIDSIGACAGWTDEDSPTEALRLMGVLDALANRLQCLVIGADNFGKTAASGVRGGSSKEDRADSVLAFLGELEVTGSVKRRRMAVRKLRNGPSGCEFPLSLRLVELPLGGTSGVLEWRSQGATATNTWPDNLRLFRVALTNALAAEGERLRPHHDGPEMTAVRYEIARREFAQIYTAKGDTPEKQRNAMREAFRRAVNRARELSLIGVCETDSGVRRLWLPAGKAHAQ